ncbi:MAG TPA: phytanoyl-CoA dioxygenase family protein [Polyangiaceae bacterium]
MMAKRSNYSELYQGQGYVVVRGLLQLEEVEHINQAMLRMHARGGQPGFYQVHGAERDFDDGYHYVFRKDDPLLAYPRVQQPHRFMPEIRRYALDERIFDWFEQVLEESVLFLSSMFFFKPPGARGQAFHQDNWYLQVRPGSCAAAWIACDACTQENGALTIVPGTHRLSIADPERSDAKVSYSREFVQPPEGATPILAELQPGDALLFDGNLIHGSEPNRSNEFRRCLVCHYMPVSALEANRYGHAPLDRFGKEVERSVPTDAR